MAKAGKYEPEGFALSAFGDFELGRLGCTGSAGQDGNEQSLNAGEAVGT
jgi:hypothetical protein